MTSATSASIPAGARVVVVGSLNIDLVVGLERMPDAGETVFGRTFERHAGGKGLNQAVAAARLGVPVTMVGAVGDDGSGDWLREVVAAEGIDQTGSLGSGQERVEFASLGRNGWNLVFAWKNNRIDHVDHTVGASDVGGNDLSTVDHHLTTIDLDIDALAVQGFCALDVDHILGHDLARNNVVSQDGL